MSTRKIINDPIYGLISFPFDHLYELIEHRYFQRLRRISQMGLSIYVYPGASHSRFAHALGALHLMTTAISSLRVKGVDISDDEYLAVCQAILLHDIGHGPFSHGLEQLIYPKHHETISLEIMHELNREYDGKLDLAIEIFTGKYERPFFHELVSSQLDMDRMDYLCRDSFYTGVAEGVIGYRRLISMMNIVDNQLVIEEKAIFSVEKFLVARHFMYWQVYLHKTSIAAERMLKEFILRLIEGIKTGLYMVPSGILLMEFLKKRLDGTINDENYLDAFAELDDIDVIAALKCMKNHSDLTMSYLSRCILQRKLHAIIMSDEPIPSDLIEERRLKVVDQLRHSLPDRSIRAKVTNDLLYIGQESNQAYNNYKNTIKVLSKNGAVVPVSEVLDTLLNVRKITKYYLCYPKYIEYF